jgi:hypothetical protein
MAFAVRGRAVWLPPVLLFASVVLLGSLGFAIANLDRGEEALPPAFPMPGGDPGAAPFGPTGEQFQLVWRVLIATIFILGIIAAIYARLTKQKTVSVWDLLGYGFGVGVIGGLVIFWPAVVSALQSLALPGGSTGSTGSDGTSTSGPIPVSTAFPIAVVIFSIVVIAVYVFALSSRIFPALIDVVKGREPTRERRRLEAASAVRRTLLDLEAGTDFRTAVMACYQRMCALIAARGVAGQEALTAREIEGLALAELGLSQGSVDDLTSLFEEARYSTHEIGPPQRDRAVECLSAIRQELEG